MGEAAHGETRTADRDLDRSTPFDVAIADFAEAYAATNERDHATLVDAIASGRVVATPG